MQGINSEELPLRNQPSESRESIQGENAPGLPRRRLIQAAALGATGLTLGIHGRADSATLLTSPTSVDVLVVGAGVSGLIASRELERNGFTTAILEARARIGGRSLRRKTKNDWWLDLGGQWMGKTHYQFQKLTRELSIRSFDSYFDGDTIFIINGKRVVAPLADDWETSYLNVNPSDLPVSKNEQEEAIRLHTEFLELAKTINQVEPWKSPNAELLDSQTIDSWMRERIDSDFAHYIFKEYTRVGGSGGYEPSDASILHLAQTYKASPQAETPEQWLLYGAAGQIPRMLAQQIKGHIHLNSPVASITRKSKNSYIVQTSRGKVFHCKAVIAAIPPTLRSRIVFDPPLPNDASGFAQRSPMGAMIKVLAVYESAWWRDQGLSGFAQGSLPAVELTCDSSPPSGKPGVLAGFVCADKAVRAGLLGPAARRELILRDLQAYWGERAAKPIDYIDFNWGAESWTTGGFTSFMTTGAWTTFGPAWREPVGNVVWAGTETATKWAGFYEGAIQAGIDAAKTVRTLI